MIEREYSSYWVQTGKKKLSHNSDSIQNSAYHLDISIVISRFINLDLGPF